MTVEPDQDPANDTTQPEETQAPEVDAVTDDKFLMLHLDELQSLAMALAQQEAIRLAGEADRLAGEADALERKVAEKRTEGNSLLKAFAMRVFAQHDTPFPPEGNVEVINNERGAPAILRWAAGVEAPAPVKPPVAPKAKPVQRGPFPSPPLPKIPPPPAKRLVR